MANSRELDFNAELTEAPVGSFHKRLGILVTLITLFDGYDTFNPAYVIHYVMQPWGLAPAQAGFLISSGLVGFLIGAIGQGFVSDRFGRRGALIGGLWIVNVFTIATALFAHDFWSFCLLRLLTGLGLGVLLPICATYINELAPRRVNNAFSLWGVALGWSLGGMFAGLVGVFVTPLYGWPALYFVGALSLPLTIAVQLSLPESPRFLAANRRFDELRALLTRIRPDRAARYAGSTFAISGETRRSNPLKTLLAPHYRRTSLTIWLTAFLSLFSIFGLTGWIPTVMMQRGETFAASFGFGALMQATSFIGGLALAVLVDRQPSASPRYLAIWWLVGGLAVISTVFVGGHFFNILIVAIAGFCIVGAQHVLNNFTASSYETGARASGVGMMLGVGRVGAILGPYVAGLLQQATGTPTPVFWAIGLAAIVAAFGIVSLQRQANGTVSTTIAAEAE